MDSAHDNVVDDDLRSQCAGLNIDPNQLVPPELQKTQPDNYELWPEHWPAWQTFIACETQWRVSIGFAAVLWEGLDYAGVERVMRWSTRIKPKHRARVFRQVQVLELEARKLLNQKRD